MPAAVIAPGTFCRPALVACLLLPLAAALADDATRDAATLDRILVAQPRDADTDAFAVPGSLRHIAIDGRSARAEVELSEVLNGVPGLLARDRQNLAQDTQLSIRGFGARATFGVRGLRLYSDGVPATLPDGQGQLSHFSLAAAERVEVLRGPFSALHGNASGGVVQLWSADGTPGGGGSLRSAFGRDDSRALGLRFGDAGERHGYRIAATHLDTDGYREHSAARRESLNAKLFIEPGDDTRIDLVLNRFRAPGTQDPLGLGAAELAASRRQATPAAAQFDTRKSVAQEQIGVVLEQALRAGQVLQLTAYAGQRNAEQFLAIPVAAQANPLHSGGVVELDNRYHGGDLRWRWNGMLGGRMLALDVGLSAERLEQQRRGHENFRDGQLGVRGALRRDERNRVGSDDLYAQASWQFAPRWSLLAGARDSTVRFASRDRYVSVGNPDDSGRIRYHETAPVAGLAWAVRDALRFHLSSGRGFETPTFNELAYRADGAAGLAFDLRPALSDHLELGAKWRNDDGWWAEAALFRADTRDELAVARNVGGRSSYRNAGRARRDGLELALGQRSETWQFELAWTTLDARFRSAFPLCSGAGCTTPGVIVPAGTRIPGLPRDHGYARLQWQPGAWRLALDALKVGAVGVDDRDSARAAGYALFGFEIDRDWTLAHGRLRGFARLDNLLDRAYVGAVIVNEGNGRYYEPGPGRGLLLGLQWDWP